MDPAGAVWLMAEEVQLGRGLEEGRQPGKMEHEGMQMWTRWLGEEKSGERKQREGMFCF